MEHRIGVNVNCCLIDAINSHKQLHIKLIKFSSKKGEQPVLDLLFTGDPSQSKSITASTHKWSVYTKDHGLDVL